ncbi:MAG: AI-2E family transporter [Lachnospiraceae bacterium]|nr:AI-2E family transporter [Lachnospiraceae bacterium]
MKEKSLKRSMFLIAFTLFLAFLLLHFGHLTDYFSYFIHAVKPFIVGAFVAFLINIPMRWIERLLFQYVSRQSRFIRFRRPVSLILTISLICTILYSVLKLVVPTIGETIVRIFESIPGALAQLNEWLLEKGVDTTTVQAEIAAQFPSLNSLSLEQISKWVQDYAIQILSTTTNVVSLVFSGATDVVVSFFFAIYLLFSKEALSRQLKMLLYAFLPERICDRAVSIGQLCVTTFCDFFSGQFIEACILGALFLIAMTILRLPYAVLISVLIAVTAMIPIFGAFAGCAIGAFLIVMVDPMKAVIFVVTFLVIQQLEGNLVYPHVVGSRVGLPSLWVLVAVSVGGSLMGLVGMLLFIPAFSVIYRIIREHAHSRLCSRQISEEKWAEHPSQKPLRIHRLLKRLFFMLQRAFSILSKQIAKRFR